MAKSLNFDTGVVEYEINGAAKVRFNPTDEGFVAKLYDAVGTLEGLQDRFSEDADDTGAVLGRFADLDAEMRVTIDGILGGGVSDALFPDMNCYAMADGLPLWTNLVMALVDEVAEAYESEMGKTDGRIKRHNEKYEAMLAKYRRK